MSLINICLFVCCLQKSFFFFFSPKEHSLKNNLKEKPSTKFYDFCVIWCREMCAMLCYKCHFLCIFCLVAIQKFLLKPPFGKFSKSYKNVFKSKNVSFCLYGRTNIQIRKHLHHLDYVSLLFSGNSINIFNYIWIINFKRSIFMSKMLPNVQQLTYMS